MKALTSEGRTETENQKNSSWDSLRSQREKYKGTVMREKMRGMQERSRRANIWMGVWERERERTRKKHRRKQNLPGLKKEWSDLMERDDQVQ